MEDIIKVKEENNEISGILGDLANLGIIKDRVFLEFKNYMKNLEGDGYVKIGFSNLDVKKKIEKEDVLDELIRGSFTLYTAEKMPSCYLIDSSPFNKNRFPSFYIRTAMDTAIKCGTDLDSIILRTLTYLENTRWFIKCILNIDGKEIEIYDIRCPNPKIGYI